MDNLSSVLYEVLKQIATQITEKARKGKKPTVREYPHLYLLSQDYKITEQRIKRGDASAGGKGAGAP